MTNQQILQSVIVRLKRFASQVSIVSVDNARATRQRLTKISKRPKAHFDKYILEYIYLVVYMYKSVCTCCADKCHSINR